MSNEKQICAICGAEIRETECNNPYPVVMDKKAVCCSKCNWKFVIPAREKMEREEKKAEARV